MKPKLAAYQRPKGPEEKEAGRGRKFASGIQSRGGWIASREDREDDDSSGDEAQNKKGKYIRELHGCFDDAVREDLLPSSNESMCDEGQGGYIKDLG